MRIMKAGRPAEVLLVEDNVDDVYITRRGFDDSGLRLNLHHVDNGRKCMAFLRQQPPYEAAPRPDLILLDLNMPVMDGREVLAEIVADQDLRRIPVVVLTTSESEGDLLAMYDLRCSSYITKPVDFAQFQRLVQQLGEYWFTIVVLPPNGTRPSAAPFAPGSGQPAPAAGAVPAAAARLAPAAVPEGPWVLVIDDSDSDAFLLRRTMERLGLPCRVEAAASVEEGLARLSEGPLPSVLLQDVRLPGASGFDACRLLRADPRTADLPVVLWTAATSQSDEEEARSAGASELIVKPSGLEAFSRLGAHLAERYLGLGEAR